MSLRFLFEVLAPHGSRSRLSVLIFHRVRPRIDPLFPTEPDAAAFEAQLRWVKDWFNVLPLPAAVAGLRDGTLPARPLCITFDDGYADNAAVALPILRKLGLHATFFIATGYLNGGRMWNDTIIEAVRRAAGPRLDLSRLGLGEVAIGSDEERRAAIAALLRQFKYLPRAERAEQVAGGCGRGRSRVAERPDDERPAGARIARRRDGDRRAHRHAPDPRRADRRGGAREIVDSKRLSSG